MSYPARAEGLGKYDYYCTVIIWQNILNKVYLKVILWQNIYIIWQNIYIILSYYYILWQNIYIILLYIFIIWQNILNKGYLKVILLTINILTYDTAEQFLKYFSVHIYEIKLQ